MEKDYYNPPDATDLEKEYGITGNIDISKYVKAPLSLRILCVFSIITMAIAGFIRWLPVIQ